MWKPLVPAVVVACLVISPLYATQRTELPVSAPPPQPRPEAQAAAKSARYVLPVVISASPQAIPQARLNVRIIGASFLPSADPVDFVAAAAPFSEPVVVRFVENALAATVHGSRDSKAPAGTTTAIASNE